MRYRAHVRLDPGTEDGPQAVEAGPLSLGEALEIVANAKTAGLEAWIVRDDTPRKIPPRSRGPLDQGAHAPRSR